MNKLSALDAYKISVILEGVSNQSLFTHLPCFVESGKAVLFGHIEIEYGRRDGRDDVSGDHPRDGAAKAP